MCLRDNPLSVSSVWSDDFCPDVDVARLSDAPYCLAALSDPIQAEHSQCLGLRLTGELIVLAAALVPVLTATSRKYPAKIAVRSTREDAHSVALESS